MRIGLIGIGQAGGKITDTLLEYDAELGADFVRDCVTVNTARQDLNGLEKVPEEKRVLIGESEVKGNGVGADNMRGRDIMQREVNEIIQHVDDMPLHELDAFVVAAALGGGTGSGGMPVLASELSERFREPVYGIGVLPSKNEGQIYTVNAARSLEACVEQTDNLMIFDNDAWSRGRGSLEQWYKDLNQKLADRFGTIFAAGEVKEGDAVAESVVDASEVMNTLNCGGITSVGHATATLDENVVNPGLLTRLKGGKSIDEGEATTRMRSLTEKAISGQLTIPANIDSTERALVVFSGPPEFMTRKGMEEGRGLVERQTDCMEVRGGDYPRPNTPELSATIVLSGLYDLPRVRELQSIAVEADEQIKKIRDERGDKLEELLQEEEASEIDNLLDL